jgi:ring-1,2-phenylacetyl-CoA epoxidase subunit PaaC
MSENNNLMNVALHLGDNTLILGHRISEWCGHGPVLEQDIAMTNIALDLIGQAKMYLDLAAELEGQGNDHDHLIYKRDVLDFKNLLITEIPNGDFADTIARQFYFDQWHFLLLSELSNSSNDRLKEIAQKALKEVTYHKRWSSEWVVRLGDGTAESKEKMQRAIDDIWFYTGEAFMPAKYEEGILPTGLKDAWMKNVKATLEEATLTLPEDDWMQDGGKTGRHTEHLGFLIAEMQFLPRAYPDATW